MVVVAITGGIGCGKSTVAALLAQRGAVIVDADQIARQVAAPSGAAYQALVDHFGPDVVRADGTLDRAAIAARVFSDPDELAALNAITHPAIAAATFARLAEAAQAAEAAEPGAAVVAVGGRAVPLVVLEIPLLTEASVRVFGLAGVVVVDAPVEVAVARLVQQRGMAEADAQARVRAQASREERRRLADVVVDNGGSRSELEASVERLWAWLEDLAGAGSAVGSASGSGAASGSVDRPVQETSHADEPKDRQEHH